jgi:hypothetical protein
MLIKFLSKRVVSAALLALLAGQGAVRAAGPAAEYERFLISPAAPPVLRAPVLSRAEARSDIAALRELVEQAYSGYDYFARSGTNWPDLFAELEKDVASRPEWPAEAFFHLLVEKFRVSGVRDNHFSLKLRLPEKELWVAPFRGHWTPYFSEYYVQRKDGRLLLLPRAGFNGSPAELLKVNGTSPGSFLFRTYEPGIKGDVYLLGSFSPVPVRELKCAIRGAVEELSVPLHASRAARDVPRPVFETKNMDGVAYVRLGSMQDAYSADLEKFRASASALRKAPVILLDLRGNTGGRDGWGNDWLAGLTNIVFRPDRKVDVLISPATLQGEVNYLRETLAEAGDAAAKATVSRRLASAEERLEKASRSGITRHWEARNFEWAGRAPDKFGGRLVILSDGGNASAGESLLQTARALDGAVVLGENSRGVNTFGPLYLYGLPGSGIKVYLPQGITLFDGELRESSGMRPDIWLDEEDFLPKALEYARSVAVSGN